MKALMEMLAPKNEKELQAFLGVINYLNKFSPGTSEACKPFRKLMSSKATWTWNASYQQLFNKAKSLIKAEMCMKFYDDTKLLYLKTDASGISLGATLLQLRDNTNCTKDTAPDNTILCPIVFVSKSLTGAERRYSNIECKALGILQVPSLLFWYRSACYYRPQTAGINIQEGCSHIVTEDPVYPTNIHQYRFRLYTNLALIFLLQTGC